MSDVFRPDVTCGVCGWLISREEWDKNRWYCPTCKPAETNAELDSHGQTVQDCEYCGPVCYRGAGHNARVEDNARFEEARGAPTNAELLRLLERHHKESITTDRFLLSGTKEYAGTKLYLETEAAIERAKHAQ